MNEDKKKKFKKIDITQKIAEIINENDIPFIKQVKEDKIKPYLDPKSDIGFKILFGKQKNVEMLRSFLKSVMNKEIDDIKISNNDLTLDEANVIEGGVDVLCEAKVGDNKYEIVLEMQKAKENYFLAREQNYMAKLISIQVKNKSSDEYHTNMLETYIVAIGEANIFSSRIQGSKDGKQNLNADILNKIRNLENDNKEDCFYFHKQVMPMIIGPMPKENMSQEYIKYPDNKMFWEFIELKKFQETKYYKTVSCDSHLLHQWLKFLSDCGSIKKDGSYDQEKEEALEQLDKQIKGAHKIMSKAQLSDVDAILFWRKEQKEIEWKIEQEKHDEYIRQISYQKGKWKGEVKGEIKQIKNYIDLEIPQEKYIKKLQFLKYDDIDYINSHLSDTDSVIFNELDLIGKTDLEFHS